MSREKGHDEVYCRTCGEPIKKKAELCPHCGVANEYTESAGEPKQGSQQRSTTTHNPSQTRNQQQQRQQQRQQQQQRQRTGSQASSGTVLSSGATEHDPAGYTTSVSDTWQYGIAASVVLWIIGFAMPTGSGVAGAFFLIAWVLMPVSVYFDRQWVRATTTWDPNLPLWVLLTVVPLLNIAAGPIYLIQRYNANEVSSPTANHSGGTGDDPALERLRDRYSRGELTDEEFERKVERVVGTESAETAQATVRSKEKSTNESDS